MVLTLVKAPDPVLKKKADPVEKVDDGMRSLMDGMLKIMYEDQGVGLAAPQVGISKRVIVMDLKEEGDLGKGLSYPIYMANPEFLYRSEESVLAEEGCLSLPGESVEVERPKRIKVKFLNYQGKEEILDLSDWPARVVQHEVDHLNGILLVDYLSPIKKDVAVRRLKKLKKSI